MNNTLKALKALTQRRKIYVQAVVPSDVYDNGAMAYTPWYFAHTDPARLTQKVIDELWEDYREAEMCKSESARIDACDAMEDFVTYLENAGYVCFYSGYEPVVTINRDEVFAK